MMEDAEKTSIFVEKMADFFRYNVKKGEEDATLEEELEAVDNYILYSECTVCRGHPFFKKKWNVMWKMYVFPV